MHPTKFAINTAMLLCALAAAPAHPHEAHARGQAIAPAAGKPVKLTDSLLQDQDGRSLRLATDAVADKVVVVTFVFTHCVDTCPMVSHTFAQVQEKLGPLLEDRVRLISLTVDPARDTPARLKQYASQFDARPGWLWLTGDQASMKQALQDFGVSIASPENHPSLIVIGDPRTGRWSRLYSIDSPQQVLSRVNELLAAGPPLGQGLGAEAHGREVRMLPR